MRAPELLELPLSTNDQRRLTKRLSNAADWRRLLLQPAEKMQAQLQRRWSKLEHPTLRRLAKLIAKNEPTGIGLVEKTTWLALSADESAFWISEPIHRGWLKSEFKKIGIAAPPILVELYGTFGWLRDQPPTTAGHFVFPGRQNLFPLPHDDLYEPRAVEKWRGALILYCAPNGDRVLLHPSGKTAWTQFETDEIHPFGSCEQLVRAYTKACAEGRIFDSWGD